LRKLINSCNGHATVFFKKGFYFFSYQWYQFLGVVNVKQFV
jgi:hypothetical protein